MPQGAAELLVAYQTKNDRYEKMPSELSVAVRTHNFETYIYSTACLERFWRISCRDAYGGERPT